MTGACVRYMTNSATEALHTSPAEITALIDLHYVRIPIMKHIANTHYLGIDNNRPFRIHY